MSDTPVFIALGSNQGDVQQHLAQAREQIALRVGPIQATSSVYRTEPWGVENQADYGNQVVLVQTKLPAREVLETLLGIEREMGRHRREQWAPRVIDLDLLFFGKKTIKEPDLEVPHPRLHLRNFVLVPLMEIAADWVHPEYQLSVEALYLQSRDPNEVMFWDA